MRTACRLTAPIASLLFLAMVPRPALAAEAEADLAYHDIEQTYGIVPGFFRFFPAEEISETWAAFKALQMNPDLGVDPKARELTGLAVAAQGDCQTCLYFHTAAAFANGASEAEIAAAASLGAATQRLHRALQRAGAETDAFQWETDLIMWGDPQTAKLRRPSFDLPFLPVVVADGNGVCN